MSLSQCYSLCFPVEGVYMHWQMFKIHAAQKRKDFCCAKQARFLIRLVLLLFFFVVQCQMEVWLKSCFNSINRAITLCEMSTCFSNLDSWSAIKPNPFTKTIFRGWASTETRMFYPRFCVSCSGTACLEMYKTLGEAQHQYIKQCT